MTALASFDQGKVTAFMNQYTIRRLTRADAAGVADCVQAIYGDSYVHKDLYDPAAIVRQNESDEIVSVVALDPSNRVVGHYAIVEPQPHGIGETGEAMVLPEHRHHELMDRMRVVLESEAVRLGLIGLFGHVVTNHVYSQKVVERFGEWPCAVMLGWSPRTFHNLAEPLTQRMSTLLYFKYLRRPDAADVYMPDRHSEICASIYRRLGVSMNPLSAQSTAARQTRHTIEYRADLQRGMIRVTQLGSDAESIVGSARDQLRTQGAEAVFLELPLGQPGVSAACGAAESRGFFFSGIGPAFAAGGDALILQWLADDLDIHALQIDQPCARELVNYVARMRSSKRSQGS
jgi:hypothetical protein